MKTVMKFPIYVEIDTDNVDRKIVTDAMSEILYPEIISYIGKAGIRSSLQKKIKDTTKVDNLDIKFLTEIDFFRKQAKS